jgi:uncharacterized protein
VVQGREPNEDTFYNMLTLLNRAYIPNGIFAYVRSNADFNQLEQQLPFFKGKLELASPQLGHSTRTYVCKNFVCSPPIYTFQELENQIDPNNLLDD